jgi:hypothetical protein
MDDPRGVDRGERLGDLGGVAGQLIGSRMLVPDDGVEAAPLDRLHDDVATVAVLDDVEHGGDVRRGDA